MKHVNAMRASWPPSPRSGAKPTREDYENTRRVIETKGSRCLSRLLGRNPRACNDWGAHPGPCTEELRLKADAQLWIRDGAPALVTIQPLAEEVTPSRWADLVETVEAHGLKARLINNGSWLSTEAVLIEVFVG